MRRAIERGDGHSRNAFHQQALAEHASVASFAAFTLQLMLCGFTRRELLVSLYSDMMIALL